MPSFHPDAAVESIEVPQSLTYNWEYASPRQRLARLYENAKRDQWNGSSRLDWSIDVDPETGDVWVVDAAENGSEIDRVLRGKSYGWPIVDGLRCGSTPDACARDEHVAPIRTLDHAGARAIVHRATSSSGVSPLSARLVASGAELVAVAPFGPSGPAAVTTLALHAPSPIAPEAYPRYAAGLALAVLLLGYLVHALVRPERF